MTSTPSAASAAGGARPDVVGVGEAMVLLVPPVGQSTGSARGFEVRVAGAELNVCVAVAALGGVAGLCSRVGDDGLGQQVLRALDQHDVQSELTCTTAETTTGLLLREVRPDGRRRVRYDRRRSAASDMDASDARRAHASRPRALVVSGVSVALGEAPARCVRTAVLDRPSGTLAVLDANLRPQLGPEGPVVAVLRDLLPSIDLLKLGTDEGPAMFGTDDPTEILTAARELGVGECVVTGGAAGVWVADDAGAVRHVPATATTVVDPVGAGDAFLGAYLLARLHQTPTVAAATLAEQVAALVVGVVGDLSASPALRRLPMPWRASK